jgi:thiol-disulfide isomerase/thioredoxin
MKKIISLTLIFLASSLFAFEELNNTNFDKKTSDGNVLVTFHATWCTICKESLGNLDEVAKNTKNVRVYLVDIGEQIELTRRFDATTIPKFVYIKDGKVVANEDGLKTKEQIKDSINRYYY